MSAPDFADLKPFVDAWGLDTAAKRLEKRTGSTLEDIEAFYRAIVPRLEEIVEFLNTFPVEQIPAEHLPLSHAALAALEIDDPVNLWRRPNLKMAADICSWTTKRSLYDRSP